MTSISLPPSTPDGQKVALLFRHRGCMAQLSRDVGVPVNRLWDAYGNPAYNFRTPLYAKNVGAAFDALFGIGYFSPCVEENLAELKAAFVLATLRSGKGKPDPSRDPGPLKDYVRKMWPIVNHNDGDFTRAEDAVGMHFLSGSICFAGVLAGVSDLPADAIERAIRDFESVLWLVENEHLMFRAFISLAGARQKKLSLATGKEAGLSEILTADERRALQEIQAKRLRLLPPSVVDYRNAVKLASTLKDAGACLQAAKALIALDPRFKDPDYAGWSTVSPVSNDPDLEFYRSLLGLVEPDDEGDDK